MEVLTLLVVLLCIHQVGGASMENRNTLLQTLFTGYRPETRPVNNTESVLSISSIFSLNDISDVSHQHQSLVVSGQFQFSWTDESLTWSPQDYGGLAYIKVQQKQLWTPDVFIRNAVTGNRITGQPDMQVVVSNLGKVTWSVMKTVTTSCAIDVTFFPIDTQTCKINLSSFIHTNNEIVFFVPSYEIQLDNFHENSAWRLKSTSADSGPLPSLPISEVRYDLVLERRASYHVLSTIFPVILLSFLTTSVFLVPPDSGERLTLASILFLSFVVFLVFLHDSVPHSSPRLSILVVYVYLELALTAVAVVLSVIILRTFDRMDTRGVPQWLQSLARWLRTLLCWSKRKSTRWMFPTWRNHFIVNHWANRKFHQPEAAEVPDLDWMDVAEVLDRIIYLVFLFLAVLATLICLILMVYKW